MTDTNTETTKKANPNAIPATIAAVLLLALVALLAWAIAPTGSTAAVAEGTKATATSVAQTPSEPSNGKASQAVWDLLDDEKARAAKRKADREASLVERAAEAVKRAAEVAAEAVEEAAAEEKAVEEQPDVAETAATDETPAEQAAYEPVGGGSASAAPAPESIQTQQAPAGHVHNWVDVYNEYNVYGYQDVLVGYGQGAPIYGTREVYVQDPDDPDNPNAVITTTEQYITGYEQGEPIYEKELVVVDHKKDLIDVWCPECKAHK